LLRDTYKRKKLNKHFFTKFLLDEHWSNYFIFKKMKLRAIPKITKEIFKRVDPNNLLIQKIMDKKLKFPLQKEFVEKILNNEEVSTNPSKYQVPLGETEKLPFHIRRTKSGSLPVYIDYKYFLFIKIFKEKEGH
jgi:hypothetical protein